MYLAVFEDAGHVLLYRGGDAEVYELEDLIDQQEVGRLKVGVYDALPVNGLHRQQHACEGQGDKPL